MFAYLQNTKGRLVGYGDFETTEGLHADPLASNTDSHNIFCGWCAQAHVSIHSCDFRYGYSQGQDIDRILLYRISERRSYKWSNFGFASTHLRHKLSVANKNLGWQRRTQTKG